MVSSIAASPVQHLHLQAPLEDVLKELNMPHGDSFVEHIHSTLVHAYGVGDSALSAPVPGNAASFTISLLRTHH